MLRSVFLASLVLLVAVSVIAKAFAWTILLRSHGAVNDRFWPCTRRDRPDPDDLHSDRAHRRRGEHFPALHDPPIYAVVAQIDPRLSEAAATLGAPPVAAFVRVVVPLSAPGVVAGVALVFSLSVSAYVIPTLLRAALSTLVMTIAKAFLISRDPASARRPARS